MEMEWLRRSLDMSYLDTIVQESDSLLLSSHPDTETQNEAIAGSRERKAFDNYLV